MASCCGRRPPAGWGFLPRLALAAARVASGPGLVAACSSFPPAGAGCPPRDIPDGPIHILVLVMGNGEPGYIFDGELDAERQRLELQSAYWDPRTFRQLDATGVSGGWRCLEVGAGAGSVARWLCQRVADGHVTATDVDTRFLEPLRLPNLEVRRHDILEDPLEESAYDLVHARLVLIHLRRATDVIRKLARTLRPGGWMVLEDFDLRTWRLSHPADEVCARAAMAAARLLEAAGGGATLGLELPGALEAAGLVDVQAEAAAMVARSGSEDARIAAASLEQLRRPLVSSGLLTVDDLDAAIGRQAGANGAAFDDRSPAHPPPGAG